MSGFLVLTNWKFEALKREGWWEFGKSMAQTL
jgi:hypothetical protein